MDEAEIAARQRENIPSPQDEPAERPQTPKPSGDPSSSAGAVVLDELALYKLHEFLGEKYSPYEVEQNKQVQFIYEQVAQGIGDSDYQAVLAEMNNLMRMLGVSNDDRRLYKLYQWLKLDHTRKMAERQMGALYA